MPQLKGKELGYIYELLLDHLDYAALSRVLQNNGLPELDEISGSGDFRTVVHKVVNQLSRRYLMVELVEGAIAELDGSCPPLQAWIESHRSELIRRRDNPTRVETIKDKVQSHKRAWTGAIVVSLILVVIGAVLNLPKGSSSPVSTVASPAASSVRFNDVRFVESELQVESDGSSFETGTLKLDVQVVNRGTQTAILSKALLHVDEVVKVQPWISLAGEPLPPSAKYTIKIPTDRLAPYITSVPISHSLKPDEPDRFQFLLVDVGHGVEDSVVKAKLELVFDEDSKSITTQPFVFTLGPLFPRWEELAPLTVESLFRDDWDAMQPQESFTVLKADKEALPALRELAALNTTNRFRVIVKKIENSDEPEELKAALDAKEQMYRHLRRAFFIEAYSSLIHPNLVPAVFTELQSFHPEFDIFMQRRLVQEYEGYKAVKLSWLEGIVQELGSNSNGASPVQAAFLLPEEIRLSPVDKITIELEAAKREREFIIGKLQDSELEDAIVMTFIRATIVPTLRRFSAAYPDAVQEPDDAKRFVLRAVFDELGLFGNSPTCLNQALEKAGSMFPWVENVRQPVMEGFAPLVNSRKEWINKSMFQLESSTDSVAVPVPDLVKLSQMGTDDLNQIRVQPLDKVSLDRELELLSPSLLEESPARPLERASNPAAVTPFAQVIVRFAAQNIRNRYRESTTSF